MAYHAAAVKAAADLFQELSLVNYATADDGSISKNNNGDKSASDEEVFSHDMNTNAVENANVDPSSLGILDLPTEIVQNILIHSDVLTVARFQRVSRGAREVVQSLRGYDIFISHLPTIAHDLHLCSRIVSYRFLAPVIISSWNYSRVVASHMSASCLLCEEDALNGKDSYNVEPEIVSAMDGLKICYPHMYTVPRYNLGIYLPQMLETTKTGRRVVGLVKDYPFLSLRKIFIRVDDAPKVTSTGTVSAPALHPTPCPAIYLAMR